MPTKTGKVLAVDDNTDILFALKLLLRPHVELITTETYPSRIPSYMNETSMTKIVTKEHV